MAYTEDEYQSLLAIKGVGKTFIARLEQMGLDTPQSLAQASEAFILNEGTYLTGSTCWKNSPQAKNATRSAIAWAKTWINNNDNQTV